MKTTQPFATRPQGAPLGASRGSDRPHALPDNDRNPRGLARLWHRDPAALPPARTQWQGRAARSSLLGTHPYSLT